ncbi:hypothetical protein [Bradyrhizobium sp. STM 3809]|uniref:hypothetical protein n=1 Tax=Bradyrhizobium sp. STM 3809 TaxID=551936 RepID=UPI001F0AB67C|nr:hypothetical protein [Bradyrhizobium sp. STM 3809]
MAVTVLDCHRTSRRQSRDSSSPKAPWRSTPDFMLLAGGRDHRRSASAPLAVNNVTDVRSTTGSGGIDAYEQ